MYECKRIRAATYSLGQLQPDVKARKSQASKQVEVRIQSRIQSRLQIEVNYFLIETTPACKAIFSGAIAALAIFFTEPKTSATI